MPDVASLLKAEIARIARRELRAQTAQLQKANARHRADIAALKKELAEAKRLMRSLQKGRPASTERPSDAAEGKALRFRASGLAALRSKLGLSAREMAQLIGVSQLTVYKWEQGKSHPRQAQLAAISAVRGIGKREARQRLEMVAS